MTTHTALTAKQAKFVREYLVDGNGTRAAVAAGYGVAGAHASASRTLRIVKVQKAVQARQSADATLLSIKRIDVLKSLLDAYTMAEKQGNPAAMISAARECGRLLGLYAPERREVEVAVDEKCARKRMNAMSDAELLSLMAADTSTC